MGSPRLWHLLALCPLALGTCVMIAPMPHGGTLGLNLLESWYKRWQREPEAEERSRLAPVASPQRFSGLLTFDAHASGQQGWSAGSAGLRPAWLHQPSGTIWGERESLYFKRHLLDREDVNDAVRHCRALPPVGYWSLPTGEELAQARRAHIADHVPDMPGLWMVQSFDRTVVAPVFVAFGPDDGAGISVRCLARSQSAISR